MNSTKKQARVAGLLYLLASIIGIFGLIYVPKDQPLAEQSVLPSGG